MTIYRGEKLSNYALTNKTRTEPMRHTVTSFALDTASDRSGGGRLVTYVHNHETEMPQTIKKTYKPQLNQPLHLLETFTTLVLIAYPDPQCHGRVRPPFTTFAKVRLHSTDPHPRVSGAPWRSSIFPTVAIGFGGGGDDYPWEVQKPR